MESDGGGGGGAGEDDLSCVLKVLDVLGSRLVDARVVVAIEEDAVFVVSGNL